MRYPLGLLLLSSSPLTVFAGGWWLDPSCTQLDNGPQIEKAITEAFDVVIQTYDIYFNTDDVRGSLEDDNDRRLFDLLIKGDDPKGVEAGKSFQGAKSIAQKEELEGSANVKIYCRLNWLKEVMIENQPYLKSKIGSLALLKKKVECTAEQAWTSASYSKRPYNVIQICPWFADKIKGETVPQHDRGLGTWYRRWIKLFEKLKVYKGTTVVDSMAYPYTTIIHELMHTHEGKNREDTGGPIGSYLWNNVVKLGKGPKAYENADNLMYFALAMKLKRMGQIVQDDGSVTGANSAPPDSN